MKNMTVDRIAHIQDFINILFAKITFFNDMIATKTQDLNFTFMNLTHIKLLIYFNYIRLTSTSQEPN